MIKKVLIANRGEIALRIIRACKELGIKTVAVYSQADADSLHVSFADEAYCIGPSNAAQSYLNIPAIISTALTCGADAIHPGYGFMSERPDFVDVCVAHGLKFIGPSADSMRLMGDKATARKTMKENGIPITPGTDIINDIQEAIDFANSVGYPVIVKATAGGGGKGMRTAYDEKQLLDAIDLCRSEAEKAFGNPDVYLEKFIENPRHIEVQIMADQYGNVVHLGERDCSVQRRHQKLIEEAPSPVISEETRNLMGEVAIKAAKAINYEGVGTIEFLFDNDSHWYFMEMNTRIQVEHCVSEMISNLDIVKEQLRIASGAHLSCTQEEVHLHGHSIECRINAENPEHNFMPCPGKINGYIAPGGFGVRVESHVYTGYDIPPYYDSMIGKLICWGRSRESARLRMLRALDEFVITGINTTIPFHKKILTNDVYISGKFNTNFLAEHMMPPKEENIIIAEEEKLPVEQS